MKITAKNKEKVVSKRGLYYLITTEDINDKNRDLLQLNKDLYEKKQMKKDLDIKEKILEEEKNIYMERYTKFTETKESIEHELIQDDQNEELQKELLFKILSMKEKTTKKIELVGLKEKEVEERECKINKELESLSTEDIDEFKRFEEEILMSNSAKIEEELKKYKMDVSKLEDLNLESCILEFQSTITLLKNSKKSKSMGDILKLKNLNQSKMDELFLKNTIDNIQINTEIENDKKLNKQYQIILSDLKHLEDTAKKNYQIQESNNQSPNDKPKSNEVYVKNSCKKIANSKKKNGKETKSKEKSMRINSSSKSKSKEKNERNTKGADEENSINIEKKNFSAKDDVNSESPIYLRHKKTNCSPRNPTHIQRLRENKKDQTIQLKTDPNTDNNIILTSVMNNSDLSNKTNDISLIKQGNILEGVKTNRTFHLLRNKRIQEIMDSNLMITMEALGGEHCCKRLKKNYDMNISISNSKIQQFEASRLGTSHYREGSFSPYKIKMNCQKCNQRSKSTIREQKENKNEEENKSIEKGELSVSKGRKKKVFSQTMREVNRKESQEKQRNIVLNSPDNLITFNNNDVNTSIDRKQINNLSKYVNTQKKINNKNKSNHQNDLLVVKPAKIETIKINTKKQEKTEASVSSTKRTANNEKLNSKLFNNDIDNDLNRSKSSLKSGDGLKNNLELKSKIFNDTQDNKNNKTILNISPIKKESSLDNFSKAENDNKTISSHFLNNNIEVNGENRGLEDSKFTE